jgi:hypothetical protein
MDLAYRFFNGLAAGVIFATAGFAIYNHAPELWASFDQRFIGAAAIVALASSLVLGFLALDSRKA